jgi:hypothetical protein
VLTTTVPGYSRRVAVTSIWQSLVHEIEAEEVDDTLGVTVLSTVRSIVVGTSEVSVMVESIVDTIVLAGRVVVNVEVVPGRDTVVVVTTPGSVIVDRIVLTEVEITVWVMTWVGPGIVVGTSDISVVGDTSVIVVL